MALYLRLIHNSASSDIPNTSAVIISAFKKSRFALLKPPQPHPRGGFIVHVDCTEENYDDVVALLEAHDLRLAI